MRSRLIGFSMFMMGVAWVGSMMNSGVFRTIMTESLWKGHTDSGAVKTGRAVPSPGSAANVVAYNSQALTRTLSFPAVALSHISNNPAIDSIITNFSIGLSWQSDARKGASLTLRKPADYVGGDVTFRIFFLTTTPRTAKVQFFIRPRSFASGEGFADAIEISSAPVDVSGALGTFGIPGTLYEQSILIPGSRLTKDWWVITIQRQGSAETYSDTVLVLGVAVEYLVSR
jgi:hypothetical protein